MKELRDGVIIDIPDAVIDTSTVKVPQEVSRFQALAALHQQNHLETVDSLIASADTMTQLAWKNVQVFYRDSPMVAEIANLMDWDETDLDNLFILAFSIKV